MSLLRGTLVTDGPSDRALVQVIRWSLTRLVPHQPVSLAWADTRNSAPPDTGLNGRIGLATRLYPCDIVFVHRDAEAQDPDLRRQEIHAAVRELDHIGGAAVCVIPVRMTEAWLLVDEQAIRTAAGRPGGLETLTIPPPRRLESLADPKQVLKDALRAASGFTGRRLKKFRVDQATNRVAELIDDFSPLLALSAFARFHQDLDGVLTAGGWRRIA